MNIDYVEVLEAENTRSNKDHITIGWSSQDFGFGQLNIFVNDGKLEIDSELMNKEFVKMVFEKLADEAILIG